MKTLTILLLIVVTIYSNNSFSTTRKVEFKNNTGQKVDDLHVVLERKEVRDTLGSTFPSVRHDEGTDYYNFWGIEINTLSTASVTFVVDSGDIKIKEWWWTKGGNAISDGKLIKNNGKDKNTDDGGAVISWNGGTSSGNLAIRVAMMGTERVFLGVPGRSPYETMESFISFINDNFNEGETDLIHIDHSSPTGLYIAGNMLGEFTPNLSITILSQDPEQPMSITPYTPFVLNLTALLEGFYDHTLNDMEGDYASISLRSFTTPYNLVDNSVLWLDSLGKGVSFFYNVMSNVSYYVVVNHRNSIETWSMGSTARFLPVVMNYNFTTSPLKAYGANLKRKGIKWCIFSGDTNQDGVIDATDLSLIDNDAFHFVSGYSSSDLNGDEIIDATDLSVADNNASIFVTVIRP